MRDLTIRGRCFLAAGLAAVVCGIQLGKPDFVRIGLLAAAVPLVAWVLVRRTERSVWVRRTLGAPQVEAGESAEVRLEVGPAGSRRTTALLMEEELPAELGPVQRFSVEPLTPGRRHDLRYLVRTVRRGRYPIGPLTTHAGDPIGMVDLRQTITATGSVLVTPRTEPLPRVHLSGRWAGTGEDRVRDLVGSGSPDVTVREYRLGDDLRRIHWPTSARTDELMVRREEQQLQARCTLFVDNRRIAHRGSGASSSLERAVSVTASLSRALAEMDFEVRLVTAADDRATLRGWRPGVPAGTGAAEKLERLAVLGPTRREHLSTTWAEDVQGGGMVVAVLGHLQTGDREVLAGLAAARAAAYAVVLDVATWERPGHDTRPAGPPASGWLTAHGWKATDLAKDGSLPSAWQELAR